jgi:tetratricopeptide (TPR) repeat protein
LEALSGTSSPQIVADGVTVLARNGFTADAVRAMKRMAAGSGLVYEAAKLRMQGEILAAMGDYSGAVETLERAAQSRATRHSKEYLARALHLAGQRERAAMLYREIVDRPWSIWNAPETEWPGTIFQAREYLKSYEEGK